jgi:hypothetical protein
MKKELHIEFKNSILCKKNNGVGFIESILEAGDYSITNTSVYHTIVVFSIYDEEGWLGDYIVEKDIFYSSTYFDGNLILTSDLK